MRRPKDLFLTLEAEINLLKIDSVALIFGERAPTTTADKRLSTLMFAKATNLSIPLLRSLPA